MQQQSVSTCSVPIPRTDPSHICEHYNKIQKYQKSLSRKSKQLQTLNRIIANLKTEIVELNKAKEQHQLEKKSMQEELDSTRNRVRELEMRQLEYNKIFARQKLDIALGIRQRFVSEGESKSNPISRAKDNNMLIQLANQNRHNTQTKLQREYSEKYFSECHASRNTQNQEINKDGNADRNKYGAQNIDFRNNPPNIYPEGRNQDFISERWQQYKTQLGNYDQVAESRQQHRDERAYTTLTNFSNRKNFVQQSEYYKKYEGTRSQKNFPNSLYQPSMPFTSPHFPVMQFSPQQFTMGQLFMGRKSKLQPEHRRPRQLNWGQAEKLGQQNILANQPKFNKINGNLGSKLKGVPHGFRQSQLNYETAISYLKKQNEHLKIPIF